MATDLGGSTAWEQVVTIAWFINGITEDIVATFTLQDAIIQAGFGAVDVYVNAIEFIIVITLEIAFAVILWLVFINIIGLPSPTPCLPIQCCVTQNNQWSTKWPLQLLIFNVEWSWGEAGKWDLFNKRFPRCDYFA